MARSTVELISAEFVDLMTGPAVTRDLLRRGHAIARRAGRGFEVEAWRASWGGAPRTVVTVRAATAAARRAEARDRVLTRAKEAGRG